MMPEISLVGVLIVAAVAFVVPLALGLVPALRVPSVVVEIVAGILIGPAVLGSWRWMRLCALCPCSAWLSCCFWRGWR